LIAVATASYSSPAQIAGVRFFSHLKDPDSYIIGFGGLTPAGYENLRVLSL
jgi:hypothetical protein